MIGTRTVTVRLFHLFGIRAATETETLPHRTAASLHPWNRGAAEDTAPPLGSSTALAGVSAIPAGALTGDATPSLTLAYGSDVFAPFEAKATDVGVKFKGVSSVQKRS